MECLLGLSVHIILVDIKINLDGSVLLLSFNLDGCDLELSADFGSTGIWQILVL